MDQTLSSKQTRTCWIIALLWLSVFACSQQKTEAVDPFCPLKICVTAGEFSIDWDKDGAGSLSIRHNMESERILWTTSQESSPLKVSMTDLKISESRGSFSFQDERQQSCVESNVKALGLEEGQIVARGAFSDCPLEFSITFEALSSKRLGFHVQLHHPENTESHPTYNVLTLAWDSLPQEGFFGFGAQYSVLNMQGRLLPIWCQEQGHGRGLEPITEFLNEASPGSGGDWYTSYTCVPYFLSTNDYGLLLEHHEYIEFDMRNDGFTEAVVHAPDLRGQILYGRNPMELIETYTEYSGRMQPLPDWTQSGAIIRSYGGSEAAYARVSEMNEVDGALAALWVEDWVGTRQTITGTRMWWNWDIDRSVYPDFEDMVSTLNEDGVRTLIYFNPFLADASEKPEVDRVLFHEAEEAGYLVKNLEGEPELVGSGGFSAGMIDLTNPEAQSWLKEIMFTMIDMGVSGWMADFGEALPVEIQLHSGTDPVAYHNQYPYEWARLNREVAHEAGVFSEHLTFHRSGNALSPSEARAFWIGDQLVTWDDFDGIKTVVPALLSSGLSGYTLQHSDVGGWLSVNIPMTELVYIRSKELFQRWMELCTFTVLLRLHTTNLPEVNHQYNTDHGTLDHFAKMTRIFAALAPYRKDLMEEAASKGIPIVRHPMLHYPDDPNVYELTLQFMLGADFMIAPVLDEGASQVTLYLPPGSWTHLWSGELYGNANTGTSLDIEAPIGEPAVFYRTESEVGAQLRETLKEGEIQER
jgi:alpha-glucosidase